MLEVTENSAISPYETLTATFEGYKGGNDDGASDPLSRHRFLQARKVVPAELRPILGRREFTWSLLADNKAELKRLHREALDEWEAQIATARALADGKVVTLTFKEVQAVAGRYYRDQVATWGTNRAIPMAGKQCWTHWATNCLNMNGGDEPPPYTPPARRIALAKRVLQEQGIAADEASARRLAVVLLETDALIAQTLRRRAEGDHGKDHVAHRFPTLGQGPQQCSATKAGKDSGVIRGHRKGLGR